jgi:hypothetical protein
MRHTTENSAEASEIHRGAERDFKAASRQTRKQRLKRPDGASKPPDDSVQAQPHLKKPQCLHTWNIHIIKNAKHRACRKSKTYYFLNGVNTYLPSKSALLSCLQLELAVKICKMKYLIRNLDDGSFYGSLGRWVRSLDGAADVGGVEQALQLMKGCDLANLELLMTSHDGRARAGHRLLKLAETHSLPKERNSASV